jgi:hypothetical protein
MLSALNAGLLEVPEVKLTNTLLLMFEDVPL